MEDIEYSNQNIAAVTEEKNHYSGSCNEWRHKEAIRSPQTKAVGLHKIMGV